MKNIDNHRVEDNLLLTRVRRLIDDRRAILGPSEQTDSAIDRIENIMLAYAMLVGKSLPKFIDREWLFLCDVLPGFVLETRNIFRIVESIVMAEQYMAELFGVDVDDIARRVYSSSMGAKFSILEFIHRYRNWTDIRAGAVDDAEIIERIKASFEATV